MRDMPRMSGLEYEADFIGKNSQGWNESAFLKLVANKDNIGTRKMKAEYVVGQGIATIDQWEGDRREGWKEKETRQRLILMKWFKDHQTEGRDPFNPGDEEEAQSLFIETASAMENLVGRGHSLVEKIGIYSSLKSILDTGFGVDCFIECNGAFVPIDITKNPMKNYEGDVYLIQEDELNIPEIVKMKGADIASYILHQLKDENLAA